MLYSLGAFIAILISGSISERIGRRRLLIIYDVLTVLTCLLYMIKSLTVLQIARFLSGFTACGQSVISGIMVTELLPKSLGAIANTTLFAVASSCLCIPYVYPYIFSPEFVTDHWALVLTWPVVVFIAKIGLTPIFITTETPKYFIKKNLDQVGKEVCREKVHAILENTHRSSQVPKVADQLIGAYE